MADRILLISWGTTVRGREERALEVFNENMGMLGRMQQEGRVESFDVALLRPNAGMGGFIVVHGTAQQIAALQDDEEFERGTANAEMIVDDIRHIEGYTGEAVARQMGMFREAAGKVAQLA
jgi:hypothetical protein